MIQMKKAVIIGAGPAGLTAAYELLKRTDIKPIVYEMSNDIGGISKTINYKGNRMDIGGHRFFSKSDRVMEWWRNIMPLQGAPAKDDIQLNRKIPLSKKKGAPDPEKEDKVMLFRRRVSRIFFMKKFFDYPISLSLSTLFKLGPWKSFKIMLSYLKIKISPIKNEKSLEDFIINRFGKELYLTFFKDYSEKLWGVHPKNVKPDWGAQRIKGVSISKAIIDAIKSSFIKKSGFSQKDTETSLIKQFLYPKFGPGQMWEEVARLIEEKGGKIYLNHKVVGLERKNNKIISVKIRDKNIEKIKTQDADYFFTSMPVKELIKNINQVPEEIIKVAEGLRYRDFITVGLLLKKLKIKNQTDIKTVNNIVPDNWIYVQERDVKMGRIQIFNNWSPYMIKDQNTVWLGLEYFCNEWDNLWKKTDKDFIEFTIKELIKMGIIEKEDVIDNTIQRMPKTYPAYFGSYDKFDIIRKFTDKIKNLFLIGRNGMHRYNNSDHSMLTAMVAVDNIIERREDKSNIWEVNTEKTYHEKKG
jgi:protoporphyrinogen oxidase